MPSMIWTAQEIRSTGLPGSVCLFLFHVQLVLQSLPDRLPGFCSQERKGAAAQLMMLGVITIILNGNSNISNGVLQGIGKPNIPMNQCGHCPGGGVLAMAILLLVTDLGVYSIVIAMIIYAVVMCLLRGVP